MNVSRETFLVDSLKHVSLQRLRRLKMDMDKLAKDSRINNDRGAFWALLDSHNIRLDERTKQDFYRRVSDHKGVDVEAAIKHLKKAQKKTGRDSVEVLKNPTETSETAERCKKVPDSTPIQITIPKLKMSTSPRNYKLDRLREKIRGIGRLQIALKKSSPRSNESTESSEQIQNKQSEKEESGASSVKTAESSGTAATAASGTFLKLLLKEENSKINCESPALNEKQEAIEEKTKTSFDEEQNLGDISAKTTGQQLSTVGEDNEECSSLKNESPLVTENECKSSPFADSNEKDLVRSGDDNVDVNINDQNNSEASSESGKEFEKQSEKFINSSHKRSESEDKKEMVSDEGETEDMLATETIPTAETKTLEPKEFEKNVTAEEEKTVDSSLLTATELDNESDNSTDDISKASFQSSISLNDATIKSEIDSDDKPLENQEALDESQHQQSKETKTEFYPVQSQNYTNEQPLSSETEEKSEEAIKKVNFVQLNSTKEQTAHSILSNPSSDEPSGNDQICENEPGKTETIINKTPTEIKENQPQAKGSLELEQTALQSESKVSDNDVKSNKKAISEADISSGKVSSSEPSLTQNKKQVSINDTEKTATMSAKDRLLHKSKKVKKMKQQRIVENEKEEAHAKTEKSIRDVDQRKNSENYITEQTESIKKKTASTEDTSDTWSISTQSSIDDNVASLDDILQDISSSNKGATEKVLIGDSEIDLAVPSWLSKRKHREEIDQLPELQVDWVYGCDTSHSQCMVCTRTGELVYFAGSIVVVYDHVRSTQRTYLEHSAPITSVVLHHSDDLVASAQTNSIVKVSTSAANSFDPQHGHTHIRVWNYIRMDTVQIIGLGILRKPVYKMAFINFQDCFVTIEEDEDSTMTVWDGGCKVTNRSSVFVEPVPEKREEEVKHAKKRFVPTRPRSNYHPQQVIPTKSLQEEKPSVPVNLRNGPRGVSGSLSEAGWYVTVGKYHLSFWELQENEGPSEEGYHVSEPEYGDFGKSFRAEFITCCIASNKYLDGCIFTGDSNGNLLMWSQRSKVVVKGFSHAHECAIVALCLSYEGYIFTSGSKDRLVKAFHVRKTKFEACGKLAIPQGMGCATSLACNDKTLFVATEKNAILSVEIIIKTTPDVYASLPAKPPVPYYLSGRSASTGALLSKHSSIDVTQKNQSEENIVKATGILSTWDDYEIARGFVKGLVSTCSMKPLKIKKRSRKGGCQYLPSPPSSDESIALLHQQMAKSARVARQRAESDRTFPPKETIYAWRSLDSGGSKIIRKPAPSAFSPRLRTNERMIFKEKVIEASRLKALPPFALANHVNEATVFYPKLDEVSVKKDLFVGALKDGWILIYDAVTHRLCGRYKSETGGDVTSLDVCSRRHLVVIGDTRGHVTITRINFDGFEVIPSIKRLCFGKGPSKVNALKFCPSGRQLAVSNGYDVIIFSMRRSGLTERGRCVGHTSNHISSLNWTTKKYSGAYFLRTSSVDSNVAELKLWRTDNFTEVSEKNTSHQLRWDSSPPLDYCSKGIWNRFSNSANVTSLRFCEVPSPKQFTLSDNLMIGKRKSKSFKRNENTDKFFVIGDIFGNLHLQPFPCLEWNSNQSSSRRAHCSEINNVTLSHTKKIVISTSTDDSNVVQWVFGNPNEEFVRS